MNSQALDTACGSSSRSVPSMMGSGDIADVAELLARAMDDDPAYRFFFPDGRRRFEGMCSFFAGNLRLHLPYRCTFLSRSADGRLLATVTLRPPGGVVVSTLTMLRSGLVPFARQNGLRAVGRMLWLKSTYEELEARASGGVSHRYVHMMAVDPAQQGRGHGSALLQRVLASDSAAATPTYLTTHNEKNVHFYRRAGFEVRDECTLEPHGSAPYTVWTMHKPIRPAA
jgi:ribosomal protein S18 acetylase RimI-like enzyme